MVSCGNRYDNSPSTKDEAHTHRIGKKVNVDINVMDDKDVEVQKSLVTIPQTKTNLFIYLVLKHTKESGIKVLYNKGDVDCDIVKSACTSLLSNPTAVIVNDTEIFVQLINSLASIIYNGGTKGSW